MWDKNGGVYFGYSASATEDGPHTKTGKEIRYVGDRHLMTIGPNGSGKSRRVLLPNLAQLKDWSIVVVDPKGDLCQMTRAWREEKTGAKPVILNPFGVLGLKSHGFNPVAALDEASDDFPDDAFGLAESMIRVEGKEPHWSASAQDLVAGLIMAVRLAMPEEGSLAHVREFLGNDYARFRENVLNMIAVAKNKECPELEAKLARYAVIDNESRELNSILSSAQTQTRWLDSRAIKTDLGKGAFDFSELKERPVTVYLTLPARRLGTHATWLRVMIASIIQPLLKDTRKPKVPVLLVLDEYPALAAGGFAVIEKNMAMFRGFGIKLWTVWQDLAQAEHLYGKGWESFVANAGVLQSFAPQDVVTAEHLSKLMPLTVMRAESENRSFDGNADGKPAASKHSLNTSEQGMPLMLPQHLRNMDVGFSVVFSHKGKGAARRYFPWKKKGLDAVYALDPA